MRIKLILAACIFLSVQTKAQTPQAKAYGEIEKSDLELKACSFEPDANALVLFDKCTLRAKDGIKLQRHIRIKIFNSNGLKAANITIPFLRDAGMEHYSNLKGQTINYIDGKPVITPVDEKSIYTQKLDRYRNAYVVSFPNVKAGSVIEYTYNWSSPSVNNLPAWYFQNDIPVRYSEFETDVNPSLKYRILIRTTQPLNTDSAVTTRHIYAMSNVHTLSNEPLMSSVADNIQCIKHQFMSANYGFSRNTIHSWAKVGDLIAEDEDFGGQYTKKLKQEKAVLQALESIKPIKNKIAYIFNHIKNNVKWNGIAS